MTPITTTLANLGPTLANHLWQSTLFAAAIWLITLSLRRNSAKLRYNLWLAASLKFLLPFSFLISLGALLPKPQHPAAPAMVNAIDFAGQPFTSVEPTFTPTTPSHPTLQARLTAKLPAALATLWLCGLATVLLIWCIRWRQLSATLRTATRAHTGRELAILRRLEAAINREEAAEINQAVIPAQPESLYLPLPQSARPSHPIQLVLSAESLEPGIFGILRPTLLWPERLSDRLHDTHIEAILAHELTHARRYDNLTAALHMFVEAIFWFHPIVWLIERRMVEERERACDEAVVHLGSNPETYAESLLKACRFCVESPLTCVAGISGADLKRRILRIATASTSCSLSIAGKSLLTAAALLTIAVPIVLGQARAARRIMMAAVNSAPMPFRAAAHSIIAEEDTPAAALIAKADQDPPPATAEASPSFEVATIRPSNPNDPTDGFHSDGRHIFYENQRVVSLIAFAYGLRSSQIVNAPEWAGKERYDVQGVVDQEIEPNLRQQQTMLRKLLAERFQLRLHHESKRLPVYAVTVAKGGPTLTASTGDLNGMHDENAEVRKTAILLRFKNASLSDFALDLGSYVDRPVVDRTGVPGRFDFRLRYTFDEAHTVGPDAPPGLITAAQEQLGLKLEAVTAMADVVVVDGIERPSMDGADASAPTPGGALPSVAEPAQAAATTTSAPFLFEVSTVKLNNSGSGSSHSSMQTDSFTATNVLLKNFMQYQAYGIPEPRMIGGPKWIDSQHFDIEAKIDSATLERLKALPREQGKPAKQSMFQQLLADRFKLAVHWETRDLPVYNLVVTKSGPTLATPKNPNDTGTSAGTGQLQATNSTLPEIAQVLTQEAQHDLGRVVIDKTGIAGRYDIWLKWTPETDANANGPSIFTAIQEQLGLKLEPGHGPVQVLVIDHAEMPTEN